MRFVLPVLLFATLVPCRAATLDEVLTAMDRAAADFRTVSADVEYVSFTKIIDDTAVERGHMWLSRPPNRPRNIRVHIEFTDPDPKQVGINGNKFEMFLPLVNTVQEYDLSKSRDRVQTYLRFSFGTSGSELQESYEVTLTGEEEVAGQQTAKLELIPRELELREDMPQVELWISMPDGNPVRQKVHRRSGDTHTVTYTGVEINGPLTDRQLSIPLPPGVKRERLGN